MPEEVFERFKERFEAEYEKWRKENITNPSQLIIWCALEKLREVETTGKTGNNREK